MHSMSKAEILCLYDEGAQVGTHLTGGKGCSFLIDVDGERTLFDTGARGKVLVHNMLELDVDIDSIDRVVISHASLDHIGGLNSFMDNRKKKVEVISHPSSWNVKRMFGGSIISEENAPGIEHRYIDSEWIQLSRNLFVTPPVNGIANESALVLSTNEGAVVISAAAEGGIVDTLKVVSSKFDRIYALVGGVKLRKVKQPVVNLIASEIKESFGVRKIVLNGCTTAEGIQKMRVATSQSSVGEMFVGDKLEFQTY